MRLLIDDTLVTAPFAEPWRAGWVEPAAGVAPELRAGLRAEDVGPDDMALLPIAELARLAGTHAVVPDVAIVAADVGAVALRTPVRPDEIDRTPVRLLAAGGIAELLARATVQPFYGITVTAWVRDEADPAVAEAQAVIVEGAEALRPVEGGYAEDLARAWFILVGLPLVSHVLVAPATLDRSAIAPALATLATLRAAGEERRREWRSLVAEREGIATARLGALFAAQRLALDPDDRRAIAALFSRGGRGASYPPLPPLRYLEP